MEKLSKPHLNIILLGPLGHGKSSLSAAVSSVSLKDGVEKIEQKEIPREQRPHEPSYRPCIKREFETEERKYTHLEYDGYALSIENMFRSANTLRGAILVVAADEGLRPEITKIIYLASILAIPSLIVCINKVDLVQDWGKLDALEGELSKLLERFQFGNDRSTIIRTSARGALNEEAKWEAKIRELMVAIDEYILEPRSLENHAFFMPISHVFNHENWDTIATGELEQGVINTGDSIEVIGIDSGIKQATITAVEIHRKKVDHAKAGSTVSLFLSGEHVPTFQPGMTIIKPGTAKTYNTFKALVYVMRRDIEENFLVDNAYVELNFGYTKIIGKVHLPAGIGPIIPESFAMVIIQIADPLALKKRMVFSIRKGYQDFAQGQVFQLIG